MMIVDPIFQPLEEKSERHLFAFDLFSVDSIVEKHISCAPNVYCYFTLNKKLFEAKVFRWFKIYPYMQMLVMIIDTFEGV